MESQGGMEGHHMPCMAESPQSFLAQMLRDPHAVKVTPSLHGTSFRSLWFDALGEEMV